MSVFSQSPLHAANGSELLLIGDLALGSTAWGRGSTEKAFKEAGLSFLYHFGFPKV